MMKNINTKILLNVETAEKRLLDLKKKLEEVKSFKVEKKIKELEQENKVLSDKIESAKLNLIKLEINNGKKQYAIPCKTANNLINTIPQEVIILQDDSTSKKPKKEKCQNKTKDPVPIIDSVVDVRKLDFRIGKIIDVNKHPDADTLYVEKIDCGENNPRTVVSGLVNYVPMSELQNKMVMVLCNLKPVKMRGILSEAMVMCASSPDKVEVLLPPSGAAVGDLVTCEGYPREPESQLNPKKKIFETCAPDLKTNNERVACYKGCPLVICGKGPITAPSLQGVSVK